MPYYSNFSDLFNMNLTDKGIFFLIYHNEGVRGGEFSAGHLLRVFCGEPFCTRLRYSIKALILSTNSSSVRVSVYSFDALIMLSFSSGVRACATMTPSSHLAAAIRLLKSKLSNVCANFFRGS